MRTTTRAGCTARGRCDYRGTSEHMPLTETRLLQCPGSLAGEAIHRARECDATHRRRGAASLQVGPRTVHLQPCARDGWGRRRARGGGGGGRRGVGGGRGARRRGRLQLRWWLEAAELMIPGCLGLGAPWPLDLEEGPAIGRRIRHPSRHSWWTR